MSITQNEVDKLRILIRKAIDAQVKEHEAVTERCETAEKLRLYIEELKTKEQ
jgi:hypothetical protein